MSYFNQYDKKNSRDKIVEEIMAKITVKQKCL